MAFGNEDQSKMQRKMTKWHLSSHDIPLAMYSFVYSFPSTCHPSVQSSSGQFVSAAEQKITKPVFNWKSATVVLLFHKYTDLPQNVLCFISLNQEEDMMAGFAGFTSSDVIVMEEILNSDSSSRKQKKKRRKKSLDACKPIRLADFNDDDDDHDSPFKFPRMSLDEDDSQSGDDADLSSDGSVSLGDEKARTKSKKKKKIREKTTGVSFNFTSVTTQRRNGKSEIRSKWKKSEGEKETIVLSDSTDDDIEKTESGEDRRRRERHKKERLEKKLARKKRRQMKSSILNDNRNISWKVRTRNGTSETVLISDTETEATKDYSTTDGQHQEKKSEKRHEADSSVDEESDIGVKTGKERKDPGTIIDEDTDVSQKSGSGDGESSRSKSRNKERQNLSNENCDFRWNTEKNESGNNANKMGTRTDDTDEDEMIQMKGKNRKTRMIESSEEEDAGARADTVLVANPETAPDSSDEDVKAVHSRSKKTQTIFRDNNDDHTDEIQIFFIPDKSSSSGEEDKSFQTKDTSGVEWWEANPRDCLHMTAGALSKLSISKAARDRVMAAVTRKVLQEVDKSLLGDFPETSTTGSLDDQKVGLSEMDYRSTISEVPSGGMYLVE